MTPPNVVAPAGWTLGRLLAIGGSAFVFEVKTGSGTPAVLKWGRWRDRDIHARFEQEAEILRRLGPPVTPSYIQHGSVDDWPYILMEHVPGEPLAAWMARSGEQAALGEILSLLLRLAGVLWPLHDAGYVHRDLKPENIVIGGADTRILDFGLAAHGRDGVAQVGMIAGTVHYLAPEQIKTGSTVDYRADLYSFGVIAFEMIAGLPPFTGERRAIEYQHQVSKPPPLRELRPDVPRELEHVITTCLAKQADARPQSVRQLIDMLGTAATSIQTLKGFGTPMKKTLGAHDKVVLVWLDGGDPITVSRAITDVHGMVVRSRPGAILAAFATTHHDAPLAVALATCRDLARDRCRVVVHVASVLVRRSAHGKSTFYGPAIERVTEWVPTAPFSGLVLTTDAAEIAGASAAPAHDLPGFWRPVARDRSDSTEPHVEPPLVGRDRLVQDVAAVASAGVMLIGITGPTGSGKTCIVSALADRLRNMKCEVIALRVRRRLFGDRPDDQRLCEALGTSELAPGLVDAGARGAIIIIDDAHQLSRNARRELMRPELNVTRVLTTPSPLFEVEPGITRRLAIEIPKLDYGDAEQLLRHLLQPARLIPDVLLQRLALRGAGNPGVLIALARDIRHRGGVRRHAGSDEWYVAADEIDTLVGAPSNAWFAARQLEMLPIELVPIARMAAALGPRFCAEEVSAVVGTNASARLDILVRDHVLAKHGDRYEFVDPSLQDAIYDDILDERSLVHGRALRYWLAHLSANLVGWLARVAYHAFASGDLSTAATCYTSLATHARRRGESELAAELDARALNCLTRGAPTAVAEAVRDIIDE